jgi:hypothetical protein
MIRIRRIGMNTTWYGYNWKGTQTQTAETPIAEVPTVAEVTTLPRPSGPTPPPPPTPAPTPDTRTQAYHYKLRRDPAMNAQQSACYFLGLWVQALVLGYEKPMHKAMVKKFTNQLIDEKLALLRD